MKEITGFKKRRAVFSNVFLFALMSLFFCAACCGAAFAADDRAPEFGIKDDIVCGDYVYTIVESELKKQESRSDNYFISLSVKNTGPDSGPIPPLALVNSKSKKEVKPVEKLPKLDAGSTLLVKLNFSVEKGAQYSLKVSGDPGGYLNAFVNLSGNENVFDPKKELIQAATDGDAQKIKELLKKGANVDTINEKKETVLMLAAASGNREAVKVLLDNKANYKVSNLNDEHALYYAIDSGDYDTVKLLLEKGANTYYTNYKGKTPLIHAKNCGDSKIIELVQKYCDKGF